jgi:signal transduction histidine kinase
VRRRDLALTLWLWMAASALICVAAWRFGAAADRIAALAAVALTPSVTGFILLPRFMRAWARFYFLGAWVLAAAMLTALGGGAASPMAAVFILAPAYALALGGGDSIAWSAAGAVGGYVVAATIGPGSRDGLSAAPECFAVAAVLMSAGLFLITRARRREKPPQQEDSARRVAEVAHELRTPLNHIVGFADMIETQALGPVAPRYVEYAGLIAASGRRLLEMIGRRLDHSRAEAGFYALELETFDIRTVAEEVVRLAQGSAALKQMSLEQKLPGRSLLVRADAGAVRQILTNLIGNAIKFTPDGGRVVLEARPEGGQLMLEVSDTGPGIPEAERERLLKPFERGGGAAAAAEGAGLGLALARALARQHGGELVLDAAPGGGALVRVRLPLTGPATPDQSVS